jgi:hypothetical protein
MVRPVEQIEQELAKLDQAVGAIAQEFHDTYTPYLVALGKAVRQQLILASYHICTHGYPEQFLRLSLHQRQELQRSLRQLAKQTQAQLADQLQDVQANSDLAPDSDKFSSETIHDADHEPNDNSEVQQGNANFLFLENKVSEPEADRYRRQVSLSELIRRSPDQPITPKAVANWQEQLEQNILEQLQNLSHAANHLLQQSKILPSQLPAPILEVASRADLVSETASSPNLLSLLIESDSDDATVTQLTTIRLRLSEIEFSDTTVALWRSKVRSLVAQLNKLGREYQKRQREKAIAQAESAWRSSWYEE